MPENTNNYPKLAGKLEAILTGIDCKAQASLEHLTTVEGLRETLREIRSECRRGLAGGVFERYCMPGPGEHTCPVCDCLTDRDGVPCAHCDELDQADREAHEQAHGPARLG